MSQLVAGRIDGLRSALFGDVLEPGDDGYDDARRVWNAEIDRRPAVIARCLSSADVAAAVRFAVDNDLEIAVRCGSHSMWGASVVDEGLMIDLTRMNQVHVDPDARRARVGGGALLGDVDAATQAHGLAVPAGTVSHTGAGGLVLGGGMGWLTRKHGLSIDNLVSVEIVTADGQVRRAAMDENDDLFWAVRGGGGNFGVVTEFEFRLHDVDPMVQMGMLFWPIEQGRELLRLAREMVGTLHPELNIVIAGMNAPPMPFVPEEHQGKVGIALVVVGFNGAAAAHAELLERLHADLPPTWEFVTPMPYVALQQMLDEPNAWGHHYYDKGLYLEELTDEAIDIVVEQLPRKTSPMSVMLFLRLDGAYSAVDDDATAFSGARSPRFFSFIVACTPVGEALPPEREWVRGMFTALQPHAAPTVYVNAVGLDDDVPASYGGKYERLSRIKGKYDPANVFRRNANIPPAAQAVPQQRPQ